MYATMMQDKDIVGFPTDEYYGDLLLSVMDNCSGTVSPWSYFGNSNTFFPIHVEDAMIASANVLVAGSPKIWITIPFPHLDRLLQVLSRKAYLVVILVLIRVSAWARSCILVHRVMFVHPDFLTRHEIPFTIARQAPGDLILADARGAHQGWNMGQNLASAVNFLDERSYRRIVSDVIRDGAAPWHCVCGQETIPDNVSSYEAPEEHSTLGFTVYHNPHQVEDRTNSVLYSWMDTTASVLSMSPDQLVDEGSHPYSRWAHLYRWMYGRAV
jgi:hypothetical protein